MKNVIILVALLICYQISSAQDFATPSLSVGVGKVLYEKGSLDAELIAEIIATKQDEVKRELMKRWVLKSVSGGSYIMKHFIAQNMETLLSEASADTKKKEMLKNAAELALVVGFAEYYMHYLKERCIEIKDFTVAYPDGNIAEKSEIDFILAYARSLDEDNRRDFLSLFFSKLEFDENFISDFEKKINAHKLNLGIISNDDRIRRDSAFYLSINLKEKILLSLFYFDLRPFSLYEPHPVSPTKSKAENASQLNQAIVSEFSSVVRSAQAYLTKPSYIVSYKNEKPYASERNGTYTSPNHILLDLVFLLCSKDENIRRLGFFQRLNVSQSEIERSLKLSTKNAFYFEHLTKTLNDKVSYVFRYYALFNSFSSRSNNQNSTSQSLAALQSEARNIIANVRGRVEGYMLEPEEKEVLKNLYSFLVTTDTTSSVLNDRANYLKNFALPTLVSLNLKTNGTYHDLTNTLDEFANRLSIEAYDKFKKDVCEDCNLQELNKLIKDFTAFTDLVTSISQLDKAETYDKIIKFIADLGELYSDKGVGDIVNAFVNAYDKYITVVKSENKLLIDVEGVAVDLFDRFGKNNKSRLGMYFTVGVNQVYANRSRNEKTDSTALVTYVSEKIGLRFNFVDIARQRAFSRYKRYPDKDKTIVKRTSYSKNPVVSNVHAIIYGSGLLYQIDELRSSNQFNYTVGGFAVGLTFFNGLDLNLGYAAEFGNIKNDFLNLSFDINFLEYLSALRKKNKK